MFHLLKKLFEDADTDSSGSLDHFELGEVVKAYYRLEGVSRSLDVAQREVFEGDMEDAGGVAYGGTELIWHSSLA